MEGENNHFQQHARGYLAKKHLPSWGDDKTGRNFFSQILVAAFIFATFTWIIEPNTIIDFYFT